MPKSLLRRISFFLLAVPLFAAIVFLCVMNANDVRIVWWPVAPALEWPLFAVLLLTFALGFLAGCALSWLGKK